MLAIDDLVEILRITDVRRLQSSLLARCKPACLPAAGARRVIPFHLSARHLGQEARWLAEIEQAFGRALNPSV
jgi:hypothetical protein